MWARWTKKYEQNVWGREAQKRMLRSHICEEFFTRCTPANARSMRTWPSAAPARPHHTPNIDRFSVPPAPAAIGVQFSAIQSMLSSAKQWWFFSIFSSTILWDFVSNVSILIYARCVLCVMCNVFVYMMLNEEAEVRLTENKSLKIDDILNETRNYTFTLISYNSSWTNSSFNNDWQKNRNHHKHERSVYAVIYEIITGLNKNTQMCRNSQFDNKHMCGVNEL